MLNKLTLARTNLEMQIKGPKEEPADLHKGQERKSVPWGSRWVARSVWRWILLWKLTLPGSWVTQEANMWGSKTEVTDLWCSSLS